MKKLLIAFVFAMALGACGNNSAELTETIRFGVMSSIDAIPFIVADELGFFEEAGVSVEIHPFSNSADRDAAFQAGQIDGTIADLVAVGLYNEGGFEVRYTGTTNGRFTLVANAAFSGFEDLKGEDVLISFNTAIEFSLDQMLAYNGLDSNFLNKESVPPIPTRMELLRNDQAASAVLPEPFSSIARDSGFVGVMSTDDLEINPFITAFTLEALESKEAEIIAFKQAYDMAVEFINANTMDAFIEPVIERVGFPDAMRDLVELPVLVPTSMPQLSHIQTALDWLRDRDMLHKDLQPEDLVWEFSN